MILKCESGNFCCYCSLWPGKNSHSQLSGIFVGENATIEIIRSDFTADTPELRKNAPPVLPEGKGEDVPQLKFSSSA